MNRLLEIGFEPAGHWHLSNDKLNFDLSRHRSQRNILYAFVSDGEVKYVGKTIQTLYERMCGYKKPDPSQTTNVRNNARIKSLLQSGAAVLILALPDNGLLHYGQFHINLAAGLEDSLISLIAPQWNGNATIPAISPVLEKDKETGDMLACGAVPSTAFSSALTDTQLPGTSDSLSTQSVPAIPLVLHKTYYNQGFFNVGVDYSALLGNDGEMIEIYCGGANQSIVGVINRTANVNQTPRIMGGKGLRDWFQRSMRPMQEATVSVLSPIAIRIEPKEAVTTG